MVVKFTLPNTKPFSINTLHYKRSNTRTAKARKWGDDIHKLVRKPEIQTAIKLLQRNFNPLVHGLAVSYKFYMPENKLFTKSGSVSKTSFDVDNICKPLTDLLFDGRFYKRGVPNINLNDGLILMLTAQKLISPTEDYFIDVEIEVVDLESFKSNAPTSSKNCIRV